MRIIAISGDGIGAGKTTLAKKLSSDVWSIASSLRGEVRQKYPGYDWYCKDQAYKDGTYVHEFGKNKTVRDVLIEYGQQRCIESPAYWVDVLIEKLKATNQIASMGLLAIDDLRKLVELERLRAAFPGQIIHMHVHNPHAISEPQYDNVVLGELSDYLMQWDHL